MVYPAAQTIFVSEICFRNMEVEYSSVFRLNGWKAVYCEGGMCNVSYIIVSPRVCCIAATVLQALQRYSATTHYCIATCLFHHTLSSYTVGHLLEVDLHSSVMSSCVLAWDHMVTW